LECTVTLDQFTLYHFPGCPFSERVETLLALKGHEGALRDVIVDISAPRPGWLLEKTGGVSTLPALETPAGILVESTAILRFLDRVVDGPRIVHADPYRHAIEEMLAALSAPLSAAGYKMILNRDRAASSALAREVDAAFARIDAFLIRHATAGTFLNEGFGWAEIMLTPAMKRLYFLEYYENYAIDPALQRVVAWRAACLAHPACQAHGREEIIKLYHDYSRGFGGGRIPDNRKISSYTIDPHWSQRPMPPRDKWAETVTDADLGLIS